MASNYVRLPKEAYLRVVDKKKVSAAELEFAKVDSKAMGIHCFLNSMIHLRIGQKQDMEKSYCPLDLLW